MIIIIEVAFKALLIMNNKLISIIVTIVQKGELGIPYFNLVRHM